MRQLRKTKEHKEGFIIGMFTMLCATMGADMVFSLDHLVIKCIGIMMMVLSAALVFLYTFRLKKSNNAK